MTKPSDFSPTEAFEVRGSSDTRQSRRSRWTLRLAGLGILLFGWLAVALDDLGGTMFIIDTVVFLAMAFYAFAAASLSRVNAVNQERKLRLRLLVHNMELENLAMRDELTQLFNRRYLFERLERELDTAKGFQRPLAFIAIKVKSLSHVNHTYGYGAGDQLLASFGQFLMDFSRATDIPARTSGSKFGIILPDTSKRGAFTMVERLTHSLAATPLIEGSEMPSAIAVSFGVSGYPWGSDNIDAIVRQAETEMTDGSAVFDAEGTGLDLDQKQRDEIPAMFRQSED